MPTGPALPLALLLLLLATGSAAAQHRLDPEPPPLNVYHGPIPPAPQVWFVAPDGDDANPGTEEAPFATLPRALQVVRRGHVIVLRGGVYHHDQMIRIQTPSGFFGEMITLMAYPGEVPILDFSGQPRLRDQHGIRLNANFWHVKGITVRYAAHNGIRMDGSYNILEQVTAYGNHDTGIHLAGGAAYNLVLHSDSFRNFNYDPLRTPRIGNAADGFGAKTNVGPGNRFVGCRAWENSDDGFDFWEAQHTILVENSWAFGNGDAAVFGSPPNFEGNGNGFKLGGNGVRADHVVRRSMAFDNVGASGNAKGFDFNNNPGAMRLEHNTAFRNGRNFWFPLEPPGGPQPVFLNNLSVRPATQHVALSPNAIVAGNSWQLPVAVTEEVFESTDAALAKGPRRPDGTLPDVPFLRPRPDAPIVDAGVAFGHPFHGRAPDIGAVELPFGPLNDPWVALTPTDRVAGGRVFDVEAGPLWSTDAPFAPGARAYADAETTVEALTGPVQVEAWIRTAQASGSRHYLFPLAELVPATATEVFVAHADAITPKPEWLAAFAPTGATLTLREGDTVHTLPLYGRTVAAGDTVALGRNSVLPTNAPMYLVLLGRTGAVSTEDDRPGAPRTELLPNYPNPFDAATTVAFVLAETAEVVLDVLDLTGRVVDELARGVLPPGLHEVVWTPGGLASGTYVLRLRAGDTVATRRITRVR